MWKSEGSQRAWGADCGKPNTNQEAAVASNVPDWLVGGAPTPLSNATKSTSGAGAGLSNPMSTGAVNQTQNVFKEDIAGQKLSGLSTDHGMPRLSPES